MCCSDVLHDLCVPPYARLAYEEGLDFPLILPLPLGLANVGNSTLKSFALVRRYRMIRVLAWGLYERVKASNVSCQQGLHVVKIICPCINEIGCE